MSPDQVTLMSLPSSSHFGRADHLDDLNSADDDSMNVSESEVVHDKYSDNPKDFEEYLTTTGTPLTHRDVLNLRTEPKNIDTQMDDLLSKGLLGLSLQDRNAINEEIHGVQTLAPEETPEMLTAALDNLSVEISMISNTQKVAYNKSQEISTTSYINSADFRLRFLRCDLFDAKKAALRIVNFLDLLLEIFGDFALRRPIQMTDFNRDELQVFRLGLQQLLPYRDRSGRRIFASVGGFGLRTPLMTRVKILMYTILAASDDVETQRKGITSIVWPGRKPYAGDETASVKWDRILFMKRIYANLPIRTCSIHFCLPDTPIFQIMRSLIILSMPAYRQRMKFHVGENIELQYSVQGYGIPIELLPLTDTGNIKIAYLKQWMKLRRVLEVMKMTEQNRNEQGQLKGQEGTANGGGGDDVSANANDDMSITTNTSCTSNLPAGSHKSIIECPGSFDVVFRSGTSMACHPGNVRFRCLIESNHEHPHLVSQKTQAELAEQLIEEIEMMGGRFLKWDNRGYWVEIKDGLQIHTKVSLSIRDYKYKTKAQRNRQTNQSFTYLFQCQDGNLNNKRRKTNDFQQQQQQLLQQQQQQQMAAAAVGSPRMTADMHRSSADIQQQQQQRSSFNPWN